MSGVARLRPFAVLLALLLAACGQTGPLYLPGEETIPDSGPGAADPATNDDDEADRQSDPSP